MKDWQFIVLLLAVIGFGITVISVIIKNSYRKNDADSFNKALREHDERLAERINAIAASSDRMAENIAKNMTETVNMRMNLLTEQLKDWQAASDKNFIVHHDALDTKVNLKLENILSTANANTLASEERFKSFEANVIRQLRIISETVETGLKTINESNTKQLDEIRGIVNEKLQSTLTQRFAESFKRVDERLAEVYKGLGEMQTLAAGVGDLKKALSNVKTRGMLGEIQLGSILDEILAPEQFERNFDAGKHTGERVEFAVKLPGSGREPVYLPIDSKFPADKYVQLCDAYDSGDSALVLQSRKALQEIIKQFAKDIRDKYINPPRTTDFAVMFLPTEGLYAEAVRLGMVEILQRSYRINLSGPSTMAALLNSLQMGFKTLAIQKRSSEVWDILAKIKKEFIKFDDVLSSTRKSLDKANKDLDTLVGVRTRAIIRNLQDVEAAPSYADALPSPAAEGKVYKEKTDVREETQRDGGEETERDGGEETQRNGGEETQRNGGEGTQRNGGEETQRDGGEKTEAAAGGM